MIIVSDCLTSIPDEGCLNIATGLAVRMKENFPETMIITYNRTSGFSDRHMQLNKLLLNKQLMIILRKTKDSVLYIPFASNTSASVIRVLILSIFSCQKINVLFALKHQMNRLSKTVLKLSQATVIALSHESFKYYQSIVGRHAFYLKTGIDTDRFKPVGTDQKKALKSKYQIPENRCVVLHVGHLKTGRNLELLQRIDEKYFIVIVVSSATEKDPVLRAGLEQRPNTRIIDTYLENIQEIYQLSDVYLFPVKASENCIDIPLSVLEAAACNIPVVTTPYGELKELIHTAGFYPLDSCSDWETESLINAACHNKSINIREAVLDYDWRKSVNSLASMGRQKANIKRNAIRIALIGLDGCGKSTNIALMKKDPDYCRFRFVWVRWVPIMLRPAYWLLKMTNNKKGSHPLDKNTEKTRLKRKIFQKHPIICHLWLLLALADYFAQFQFKVLPLVIMNKQIIFDRFYLDLFVDQGINFGYQPARIAKDIARYQRLFPRIDKFIYLRVSPQACLERKNDIPDIDYLRQREEVYEYLANACQWSVVNADESLENVNSNIKKLIVGETNA